MSVGLTPGACCDCGPPPTKCVTIAVVACGIYNPGPGVPVRITDGPGGSTIVSGVTNNGGNVQLCYDPAATSSPYAEADVPRLETERSALASVGTTTLRPNTPQAGYCCNSTGFGVACNAPRGGFPQLYLTDSGGTNAPVDGPCGWQWRTSVPVDKKLIYIPGVGCDGEPGSIEIAYTLNPSGANWTLTAACTVKNIGLFPPVYAYESQGGPAASPCGAVGLTAVGTASGPVACDGSLYLSFSLASTTAGIPFPVSTVVISP